MAFGRFPLSKRAVWSFYHAEVRLRSASAREGGGVHVRFRPGTPESEDSLQQATIRLDSKDRHHKIAY